VQLVGNELFNEVVLFNSASDEPVSSFVQASRERQTCSVTSELEVTCDVGALVGRGHGH
jgi:hypothetical protein